jgi:hypothetical protein
MATRYLPPSHTNIHRYAPERKGAVNQSEWNQAADRALASVDGLTDREAGDRLSVSYSTVQRWRHLRNTDEDIPEPRGAPRDALLRFISQDAERAVTAQLTMGELRDLIGENPEAGSALLPVSVSVHALEDAGVPVAEQDRERGFAQLDLALTEQDYRKVLSYLALRALRDDVEVAVADRPPAERAKSAPLDTFKPVPENKKEGRRKGA